MVDDIRIPGPIGTFDAIAAGPVSGEGVLLLHGFPEAGAEWEHQVHALGLAGYRAVAPDQRGYSPGVRPERVEDYRMAELIGDILSMADGLGWSRFHLVGHDWGAAVAWATATKHPGRLLSLTAASVPHLDAFSHALRTDPDQQARSVYMAEFREPGRAERHLLADNAKALRAVYQGAVPPARIEDYVRRFSEPGALTAALNWYRAVTFDEPIGQVTVPTLYVWSTNDPALGSVGALGTRDRVDGPYRFEILEDVTHWIPEEVPEAFSALLLEHLAQYRHH